jgi:hypothetical protein
MTMTMTMMMINDILKAYRNQDATRHSYGAQKWPG